MHLSNCDNLTNMYMFYSFEIIDIYVIDFIHVTVDMISRPTIRLASNKYSQVLVFTIKIWPHIWSHEWTYIYLFRQQSFLIGQFHSIFVNWIRREWNIIYYNKFDFKLIQKLVQSQNYRFSHAHIHTHWWFYILNPPRCLLVLWQYMFAWSSWISFSSDNYKYNVKIIYVY